MRGDFQSIPAESEDPDNLADQTLQAVRRS
jgi:hypothetical protein